MFTFYTNIGYNYQTLRVRYVSKGTSWTEAWSANLTVSCGFGKVINKT